MQILNSNLVEYSVITYQIIPCLNKAVILMREAVSIFASLPSCLQIRLLV